MGVLSAIGGFFASGFGLLKLVKIIGIFRKAKKFIKEANEARKAGAEFIAELKNSKELAKEIWKDGKMTKDERILAGKQLSETLQEAEKFYKEAMDVYDLFT